MQCPVQAFREEVAPLRQDVRLVNELSAELTPLDIQLSSTASRQLDQLNMRWKLLQVDMILLNHLQMLKQVCFFRPPHRLFFLLDLVHTCQINAVFSTRWSSAPPFPACLCVFISSLCLCLRLPQFVLPCACRFYFVSAKHTGDWELFLHLCTCFIWTQLCSQCNTLSRHSHRTSHILGSLHTSVSRSDLLRDCLNVEHVSVLQGKLWKSLF